MKTFIPFLIIAFICPSAFSQDSLKEGIELRILSYNILHGATTNRDNDLDLVAEVIKQIDPDLVALQEVDYKTKRVEGEDIGTALALKTGMNSIFAKAVDFDGGAYGQSLFSKWPFLKTEKIDLPGSPDKEPRIAATAIIVLPQGDTLNFIGTHLDHESKSGDRLLQAGALNELLKNNHLPTILAGDLNDVPGSPAIEILESNWESSYDSNDPEPTFPSSDPRVKIDYVMVYPQRRWEVLKREVICHKIASDHCAYLVVLKLLPEKK